MPQRMMTLAEELAGHCLAVVHPLQPWGQGRTKKKKKKSEGKKEKERNNGEGETAIFYGDRASLGPTLRGILDGSSLLLHRLTFQPHFLLVSSAARLLLNSRGV